MKCLYPNCRKSVRSRGLCVNHYATTLRLVNRNLTTWEALEKAGKCKPSVRPREHAWFLNK